jgi:hypothetical protein
MSAPPKVENVGGGRTPPQISHRKDQPGSLGIEEKISQASRSDSTVVRLKFEIRISIENGCDFKLVYSQIDLLTHKFL